MLTRRPSLAAAAVALSLAFSGCKPDHRGQTDVNTANLAEKNAEQQAGPGGTPVDPAITGTVTGTVHFAGKAPEPIRIDMSQDPACSLSGDDNVSEQVVVHHGALANTYIYVKNGPTVAMNAAPAAPLQPVTLDQKGCRYIPHVIAVEHDQPVRFTNSDPTMHNIHTMPTVAGNETIDVSQGPRGEAQVRRFHDPEVMMPVRCNNHPWMNAFINVSATPFFAVSAADGTFTIPNLPEGTYTLTAVQEKLGSQDIQITVKPHTATTANFTFKTTL